MQQSATGIAKSTLCLYDACLKLCPELQISAIHRKALQCMIPLGIKSVQHGSYLPDIVWRKYFLPWYAATKKPTAIHFPWNGDVPGWLSNTHVITTLNDVLPLEIPGFLPSARTEIKYRQKVQQDIDRTDLLVTVSEYSKKKIIDNFVVKREPIVVHSGPTLSAHTQPPFQGNGQHKDYFIYVGGYDPRKGIDTLARIFINLHIDKKLRSKLVLTGSKRYYSLEFKSIIDQGVAMGIIEEKGYVSDMELASLIQGAKALVYPSKYEGFGLPPLEAMSLGCPVITTRSTSIPEICGDAAYYINPDNDRSFASALVTLENDTNKADELKLRGIRQSKRFCWNKSASIFMTSLDNLSHKFGY